MKPVKRGIKMWVRCDSLTGYMYDMNVYAGAESVQQEGTLGERVVLKLMETIQASDVVICFDRFFSSVRLFQDIKFPAVGTCIRNRKNIPKYSEKLQRGESVFFSTTDNIIFTKWQDTKEVLLLSNCHSNEVVLVKRKTKNGKKVDVTCPEMIAFYNKFMGGVDIADQKSTTYDLNRRSAKWWKKVFFRLIMIASVNSWIIYDEKNRRKGEFIDFLADLAEEMAEYGKKLTENKCKRRSIGRPSKTSKQLRDVGGHLPIIGETRRRCARCAKRKVERRTKQLCQMCNIPLCKFCFTPFHV